VRGGWGAWTPPLHAHGPPFMPMDPPFMRMDPPSCPWTSFMPHGPPFREGRGRLGADFFRDFPSPETTAWEHE